MPLLRSREGSAWPAVGSRGQRLISSHSQYLSGSTITGMRWCEDWNGCRRRGLARHRSPYVWRHLLSFVGRNFSTQDLNTTPRTAHLDRTEQMEYPKPLNQAVRSNMRAMPRRDTGPEVILRRAIHSHGLRYRLRCADLPCRPDFVFPRQRIAVFVDGCFWHYCPQHCVVPKNNRLWWLAKLRANRRRDRRNDKALEKLGWVAIHVWEHENYVSAANRISRAVRGRRG